MRIASESSPQVDLMPEDRFHPAALSIGSALLLWLSYPPADRGYLAWFALAPFLMTVQSRRTGRSIFGGAWLGGLTFGGLAMWWVSQVSIPGWALMALFMSLWWPLFLYLARLGVSRLKVPLVIVAPAVWVALEYARTLILSGFPWYYLAHTQYAYIPLIQISDLLGAWGLSLVLMIVNVLVSQCIVIGKSAQQPRNFRPLLWRVGTIAALLLVVVGYGQIRLTSARFLPGPNVALLQTDFPQELGNGPRPDVVYATIDRLLAQAVQSQPYVDLIVWPESSYPIGVVTIDKGLAEADLVGQVKKLDPESSPSSWRDRATRSREDLAALLRATRTPMVIGTTTYAFAPTGVDRFNSAVYLEPGLEETQVYHKRALVPFGEYVPFLQSLPWLLALTPYQDGYVPSLTHGGKPVVIESQRTRYAPVICFEDTLPAIVRQSMIEDGGRPVDVLLNLTNDGWFRGSSEHLVHLAISTFRAVECRVPVARAVNTGISAIIDGNGRTTASLAQATAGVLKSEVPLDPRTSLYLWVGDWLPRTCLVFTIGLIVVATLQFRHTATLAHNP